MSYHVSGQRICGVTDTADHRQLVLGEHTPPRQRLGHRGVRPPISGTPRHRRLQRVFIGGIRHPTGNSVFAARTSHEQRREGVTIMTVGMHESTDAHVVALQRTHVLVGTTGLLPIGPIRRLGRRLRHCFQPGVQIQSRHPRRSNGELVRSTRRDPEDERGFAQPAQHPSGHLGPLDQSCFHRKSGRIGGACHAMHRDGIRLGGIDRRLAPVRRHWPRSQMRVPIVTPSRRIADQPTHHHPPRHPVAVTPLQQPQLGFRPPRPRTDRVGVLHYFHHMHCPHWHVGDTRA